MSTTLPKKLGQRQLAIIRCLEKHDGTSDFDTLARVVFGSVYRRPEARKAVAKLEARGLVTVEREDGTGVSVSLVAA
jgi:DNA-binding MarR family transcriptional regulator